MPYALQALLVQRPVRALPAFSINISALSFIYGRMLNSNAPPRIAAGRQSADKACKRKNRF